MFLMSPRTSAAIVLLAVSLVVLTIGYFVGWRKQLSWVSGLDASKVRDSDGLARWIGVGLSVIGMLDLLIGLSMLATSTDAAALIVAYVAVSLVGAAVLLFRLPRYVGPRADSD